MAIPYAQKRLSRTKSRRLAVFSVGLLASSLLYLTGTASPADATGTPPAPGATGEARGATQLSFQLTNRLNASVNVASGNLMVISSDLNLPGMSGDLRLGAAYNSLLAASSLATGSFGAGWTTLTGADSRLVINANNTITYVAPGGDTGTFTSTGGSTYSGNSEFKGTLTGTTATSFTLTDHSTGSKETFTGAGVPTSLTDRTGLQSITFSSTQIVSNRGGGTGRTENIAAITKNASSQVTKYTQTGDSGIGSRSVTYTYPSGGAQLQKITEPSGETITFGYTGTDLTSINVIGTNGIPEETTFAYDTSHRVTSIVRGTHTYWDATTRLKYVSSTETDVAGPDQTAAFPGVPHTTYTIGPSYRVTKTVDADGHQRSTTYTTFFDTTSTVDGGTGGTNTTSATFGPAASPESVTSLTSGAGAKSSYTYASSGTAQYEPATATDEQNNPTSFTYDGPGNVLSTTSGTQTASVTRNANGTIATSTDPGNGTLSTGYTYTNGALTKVTPPAGQGLGASTYTYDGYGRLATATSGKGIVTTYGYDLGDEITSISYSDYTPTVTYTYDGLGNVLTRADTTGTTTYTYDELNELHTRTATAGGGTETYTYDAAGNISTYADARGTVHYNTYSPANQLLKMTTALGTVTQYAYDTHGRRQDAYFATNATNTTWAAHTHWIYDASNRPTTIWTSTNSSDSSKVQNLTYSYSHSTGGTCAWSTSATDTTEVQTASDAVAGTTTTYCYDPHNRLTKAVTTGSSSKTYTYGYDVRNNRTSASDGTNTQTLAYNAADLITTTGYVFDQAGNLTYNPKQGATFTYNGANQMTGDTFASGSSNSYTYAGPDERELTHVSLVDGTVLDYTYGAADSSGNPELMSIRKAGTTNPYYVTYDATGTPQVLTTDTGNDVFFLNDGVGSMVGLIKSDGSELATYSYDPYGQWTDNNITGNSATREDPFRFGVDGLWDHYISMIKYGVRWYDASLGRFLQPESSNDLANASSGNNKYEYVADDPVNGVDPSGRSLFGDISDAYDIAKIATNIADGNYSTAADEIAGFLSDQLVDAICEGVVAYFTAGIGEFLLDYGCEALGEYVGKEVEG